MVSECCLRHSKDLSSLVRNLTDTKKSIHVKGWCGPGRVRSSAIIDGLDAPGLCILSQWLECWPSS